MYLSTAQMQADAFADAWRNSPLPTHPSPPPVPERSLRRLVVDGRAARRSLLRA